MTWIDEPDEDWVDEEEEFGSNDDSDDDMMECPSCGRPVYDDTQKCPHCGDWIIARLPSRGQRSTGSFASTRSIGWVLIVVLLILLLMFWH